MSTITLFFRNDLYEITYSGATIVRIQKYLGESQHVRTLKFADLHPDLQDEVIARLSPPNEEET